MALDQETVDQIIKRYERAKSDRAVWDSHWQEVADLVRPEQTFNSTYTGGEKRRRQIYDDTAPNAADDLAAALDGLLTNTSIRWFDLIPADPSLVLSEEQEAALYDSTSRMLRYLEQPASGFAVASHELYLDLVCFGTGTMIMLEQSTAERLMRFQARSLPSIYLEQDDEGIIIAVHRTFELDPVQMAERWGNACSEEVLHLANEGNREKRIPMLHSTTKRSIYDPSYKDVGNKPWSSCYIDIAHKRKLSESGFDYNPYLTPRWSKIAEEVYGRSPAMRMLPSIKAINLMGKTVLEAAELTVRPPLMVPANGIEGNLSTIPGSFIYVRQGTREFPQPLQTGARPDFGETELERRGAAIKEAFYSDKFKLPESDRMTATEIVARRQQGLLIASPVLGRLYSEFLNPLITRLYDWMVSRNMVRKVPGVDNLNISYRSPLAASRGSSQAQSFNDLLISMIPVAQLKPTVIDNLNEDASVRLLARYNNLDPKFLRTQREMRALRQQQAQQQQMAMQLAAAEQGSVAAKNAAQAAGSLNGAGA